jgi:RimJ/RimL family protein N-acetyltransferase
VAAKRVNGRVPILLDHVAAKGTFDARGKRASGVTALRRGREAFRRHGGRGVLRAGAQRVAATLYLREDHVWYALPLGSVQQTRELPADLELVRAKPDDAALAVQHDRRPDEVARQVDEGHELWIVRDDDRVAFSCWIYVGRAPAIAAPGGWFAVPRRWVCLEDSITSPDYRGRGVAPAAWEHIAAHAHTQGADTMVTKVAWENTPSRKAVSKAGFEEVGVMRLTRIGPRRDVRFSNVVGETGKALAQAFGARVVSYGR